MGYEEVYAEAKKTPVIETHEHQSTEAARIKNNAGWRLLIDGYATSALVSAGLDQIWWDGESKKLGPVELWRGVEKYFYACEHSSYIKAVKFAAAAVYGIDKWNNETIVELERKVKASHKPGVNRRIFRDIANVDCYHVNSLDGDPRVLFRQDDDPEITECDLSTEGFTTIAYRKPDYGIKQGMEAGVEVKDFKSFVHAIDAAFEKYAGAAIATKNQTAYTRVLRFEERSESDVAKLFDEKFMKGVGLADAEKLTITDWLFHYCIAKSGEYGLAAKIHTGYLAGTGYMRTHSVDPSLLENIFMKYPKVKFDLFHIGYPFIDTAVALVKHYPNVYIDMCWAWAVDWEGAKRFLKQAITAAPHTKIFAAGGDTLCAENTVGHIEMARRGAAQALSELVDEGYLNRRESVELVSRLFRENQLDVFGRKRTQGNMFDKKRK